MSEKPKKLILIDGNAIIHRAYHALPPLTTKKGELVNAVYGFTSTVLSVMEKFKPDYVLATFDLAGPTFRHAEYKEYKAKRVKADQELYDQIPRVKEVTRAMGIPIFEKSGFEADDLIGTLVAESEKNGQKLENIIVTGDLDTLQLVSPKTKVYTMRRGLADSVLYDEEKIIERYGLRPGQLIDFKGLRGDPSDNIPGVRGIGEKTASELLKKFGDLENIYKNLGELKGAVKEKLERDKIQALKSKHLATIVRNVPVEFDLEKARVYGFDRDKLVRLLQELNFYSLMKRIPECDANLPITDDTEVAKDFSAIGGSTYEGKYEYITQDKAGEFFETLSKQKEIAIHLKTGGEKLLGRELEGIALALETGRVGYLEYGEKTHDGIRKILENAEIEKIGYDLKRDIEILKKHGINLRGNLNDVMIGAYVLNPGGKIDFSHLVLAELGEEIREEKSRGQLGLEMESPEETAEKKCKYADYIWKLGSIFLREIKNISAEQGKENNLEKVFLEIEIPLIRILAEMEMNGVRFNPEVSRRISGEVEERISKLEKNIYDLAGGHFNINSPRQLAEILFVKLKIPTDDIKKGKTGYSTASAELQKIKSRHKIVAMIEDYREVFKLKTTYLDTLPLLVEKDFRIHAKFNQGVTATGRLSSSEPNLQNIPIRTELGHLIRTAFEAEKGWCFLSADYSQIDLRAVAHVSGDKKMIDLFWAGEDIHRATAAEINRVSMSKVTQKMRSAAKALNFGVIYGMSVFGFSQSAGIGREEAKKFIDAYFEKFQGVANYMKETKTAAKINGYVETEMGRRRYVPEINSPNFQVAGAGERMAINMPIQGMSADIMKLAMVKVAAEYENNPDVKMVLQVHDEIILEVKKEIAEKVARRVKEIMENVYKLKVPLVADVEIGDNWGEI